MLPTVAERVLAHGLVGQRLVDAHGHPAIRAPESGISLIASADSASRRAALSHRK